MGRGSTACCPSWIAFAAGRTQVGARFIVHSSDGGRGEATPLPSAALRRPGRDGSPSRPFAKRVSYRHRFNGGLGEPALPKAGISGWRLAVGLSRESRRLGQLIPFGCRLHVSPRDSSALGRDGSPSRPFAMSASQLDRDNGGLGEPALPRDYLAAASSTPASAAWAPT